jgi:thiol-disulfide isomerase/thioredoxin
MKNRPLGCLAVLALGAGALWFLFDSFPMPGVFNQTPPSVNQTSQLPQRAGSRYIVYSQEAFDAARNKKRVLYFHAPWCSTCVPTDKEFSANADKIPEDVVLFKTDYDTSTELKKKYAVPYQHTFVLVDAADREITKWNGGAVAELVEHTK